MCFKSKGSGEKNKQTNQQQQTTANLLLKREVLIQLSSVMYVGIPFCVTEMLYQDYSVAVKQRNIDFHCHTYKNLGFYHNQFYRDVFQ